MDKGAGLMEILAWCLVMGLFSLFAFTLCTVKGKTK